MGARNKERNAFRSWGELRLRVLFSRKALRHIRSRLVVSLTAESLRASLLRAPMGPLPFHHQHFFTESLAVSETLGSAPIVNSLEFL